MERPYISFGVAIFSDRGYVAQSSSIDLTFFIGALFDLGVKL
jgi:hypothetical protein